MPSLPNGPLPHRSLEEVHRSVQIPTARWWYRLFAFAGPAYLVSVGYMDPGNWATDLEGGSKYGYRLIWVLLMSNAMAVLLQTLSARLGLVTGRDFAQACHDEYPRAVNYVLFALCEIAVAACDLAEVIGSAIGLNLLFGIDILWGVLITGGDVLLLLAVQRLGIRKLEAFVLVLVTTIGVCFLIEIYLSRPPVGEVLSGFVPGYLGGEELFLAIGILGATVMPHNLYMHSALVQSRDVRRSREAVAEACRFNLVDSAIAMNCAFLVNAAILVVAGRTFFGREPPVTQIEQAPEMLKGVLGSGIAPIAFAIALLCSGQSSTITGTLAGQITMEGFLRFRVRPWVRRLVTRSMAIVPAVLVILVSRQVSREREQEQVTQLLIVSQVVLSLQLSFAVVPLVRFTSSRQKMGPFANSWWVQALAWAASAAIIGLNGALVYQQIGEWTSAAGPARWLVAGGCVPAAAGLAGLLAWMIFRREEVARETMPVSADEVLRTAATVHKRFRRIGVALDAEPTDSAMLAEAIDLAKTHGAELVLMHVVSGAGGQWYGAQTGVMESRHDEAYLHDLAERLRAELHDRGIPAVETALGYGDPAREIVALARDKGIDLVVLGGHGHKGLLDWLHGETITGVRHGLSVPILAVRQ